MREKVALIISISKRFNSCIAHLFLGKSSLLSRNCLHYFNPTFDGTDVYDFLSNYTSSAYYVENLFAISRSKSNTPVSSTLTGFRLSFFLCTKKKASSYNNSVSPRSIQLTMIPITFFGAYKFIEKLKQGVSLNAGNIEISKVLRSHKHRWREITSVLSGNYHLCYLFFLILMGTNFFVIFNIFFIFYF